MLRSSSLALACTVLAGLLAPGPAAANPPPTAFVPAGHRPHAIRSYDFATPRSRNAGAFEGRVTSVDYQSNTITVQGAGRRMEIVVLPSTTIQADQNGFHTIADIARGSHIHVLLSQRGDAYFAQFINLK